MSILTLSFDAELGIKNPGNQHLILLPLVTSIIILNDGVIPDIIYRTHFAFMYDVVDVNVNVPVCIIH
jgi:hypothetical protein